ncbi:hypothetical protein GCM10027446_11420 [Angustibacter peucedani]
MQPLWRRAPGREVAGAWGGLVLSAFVLLAAAAASGPVFAEASSGAAVADQLRVVPDGAPAGDGPVVRVVGGVNLVGRGNLRGALDDVPGLGEPVVTAASVGRELLPGVPFTPYVLAGGRQERARLMADDAGPDALVVVERATGPVSGPALWFPAPLAARMRVEPGDQVVVGVERAHRDPTRATATVAGTYRVAADGRTPADPPGTRRWSYRRAALPTDTEFGTLPSQLLVTDVATATAITRETGDTLLYSVEAQLDPVVPTLAHARETVAGIRELRVEVRDPSLLGQTPDRLREQVVSGLPDIVQAADDVARRTVAWTRTQVAAGTALGLLAVLGVAVLTTARRSVELRHAAGLGVRPLATATREAVGVVVPAVVGVTVGVPLAWVVVRLVGPQGRVTTAGLGAGAVQALAAVAGGVLLTGLVTGLAARRASRLTGGERRSRPLPWELVLAAVAVALAVALATRPVDGSPPGPTDLLLPVLVLAATGALGGRLALDGLDRVLRVRPPSWARRPALALALRRVSGAGRQGVLVVCVVAVGLGLLAYAVAASASVGQVAGDRAAARAGAVATADVEASWLLDPGAALVPEPEPGDELLPPDRTPVPGARVPPLPEGTTMVWRTRTTVPPEFANLDLLVVDPARFADVASWGTGPELARARALVRRLGVEDRAALARMVGGEAGVPVPALEVGDVLQGPGDKAALTTRGDDVPIQVLDVVPTFPGHSGSIGMVVVPADSFFSSLGVEDPRLRPPGDSGRFNRAPAEYYPALWSSRGSKELADIAAAHEVRTSGEHTLAEVEQQPDLVAARRSRGYQVALGACVALVAVLVLAMAADRGARRALAADLVLARAGLGRRGTRRARLVELSLLAAIALVLGFVGLLLVRPFGPRLLDPGGAAAPAFVLRVGPTSVLAGVATAVVALGVAVLAARARVRRARPTEVLRDD